MAILFEAGVGVAPESNPLQRSSLELIVSRIFNPTCMPTGARQEAEVRTQRCASLGSLARSTESDTSGGIQAKLRRVDDWRRMRCSAASTGDGWRTARVFSELGGIVWPFGKGEQRGIGVTERLD
jgi:hypothetical protein